MSQLSQVRSLCQDKGLFYQETLPLNLVTQLKWWPVVASVPIVIVASPAAPAYTIDYENGVLTFNTDPAGEGGVVTYYHSLLSDQTITDFLTIEGSYSLDVNAVTKLAAADSLDAMASNQAIIQKKLTMLDFETDGPAVAKALRDGAEVLRKTVFDPAYQAPYFDIIEQINDYPGFTEKILKDIMRQSL